MKPILFAEVSNADNPDTGDYPLTGNENQLLLALAKMVVDDPALYFSDYDNFTSDEIQDLCEETLIALMKEKSVNRLMQPLFLLPYEINHGTIVGSALIWVADGNTWHGGYFRQTTAAINNAVEFINLKIEPGDYSIWAYYRKTVSGGIADIGFNLNTFWQLDTYNPTTLVNQVSQSGIFTISASDLTTLTIKIASKNPSSVNYDFAWMSLRLYRHS